MMPYRLAKQNQHEIEGIDHLVVLLKVVAESCPSTRLIVKTSKLAVDWKLLSYVQYAQFFLEFKISLIVG
jgi:hypothetical protein